ncbi:hypothetical protein LTR72_011300 [Exophiala xenobiotica]|nr:hypothetical protein LTR72_011300 [Exophiala xenobiotica]KAK5285039.1 hypothetical protein LTR14_011279 [Exophiala xenobiotica]KAK5469169.1 hypothetical protein LTR55_011292 [Exophiala xenobiotica]
MTNSNRNNSSTDTVDVTYAIPDLSRTFLTQIEHLLILRSCMKQSKINRDSVTTNNDAGVGQGWNPQEEDVCHGGLPPGRVATHADLQSPTTNRKSSSSTKSVGREDGDAARLHREVEQVAAVDVNADREQGRAQVTVAHVESMNPCSSDALQTIQLATASDLALGLGHDAVGAHGYRFDQLQLREVRLVRVHGVYAVRPDESTLHYRLDGLQGPADAAVLPFDEGHELPLVTNPLEPYPGSEAPHDQAGEVVQGRHAPLPEHSRMISDADNGGNTLVIPALNINISSVASILLSLSCCACSLVALGLFVVTLRGSKFHTEYTLLLNTAMSEL